MDQEPWQTARARSLRREMTSAERIIWKALRGRRFDELKFRRQHPVLGYVLDFFCLELQLALEIDGETHLGKEEHDEKRTRMIEGTGIKIVRFWNTEVYDEFETVCESIWRECESRRVKKGDPVPEPPPSPPAPLPKGEGSSSPRHKPD